MLIECREPGENTPDFDRLKWGHFQIIYSLLGLCSLFSLLVGAAVYFFISLQVPDISSLANYLPPLTSLILDDKGEEAESVSDENRFIVSPAETPKLLAQAFVAAEDGRFYEHTGVDGWSILRAFLHNLHTGDRSQGGSTITQQVARSLLLTPKKTYTRKIREAILAYRIDRILAKENILHIYLNQIYLGEGAFGIEAAARTYFDKHVGELNLAEISLLAGLPQAPSRYSPFKHYKLAKKRQVYVLNRMAELGFITPTAARQAYRQNLLWRPKQAPDPLIGYFTQYVKKYVEQKYGRDFLTKGGLTVYTTLDQTLQRQADLAIKKGINAWAIRQNSPLISAGLPQAAIVAIEIQSGKVRAMTGGTNYDESQFNRATQALRQPGSAFKPIIYATALVNGMTPATIINDEPLQLQGETTDSFWTPQNFDGTFQGPTTLRNGLVFSRNIVTIKILQQVGINNVVAMAEKLGIHTPLAANLSLALGSSDVSLLDLTTAYAVFARGGRYIKPVFVTKIIDRDGHVLEKNTEAPVQVLDERTAYQITHLLKQVINKGTGIKAKGLNVAAAGKTGTTDKNMDAWFIGYTPNIAAGVWLGYDQKKSLGINETGGQAAAPVWLAFLKNAKKYFSNENFLIPEGITISPMNNKTGEITYDGAEKTSWQAFRDESAPARLP